MTAGPVDLRYKFDNIIHIWMLPGIVWNCPWFRPIFFFLVIQARNNIIFESVYSVYGSLIQKFLI